MAFIHRDSLREVQQLLEAEADDDTLLRSNSDGISSGGTFVSTSDASDASEASLSDDDKDLLEEVLVYEDREPSDDEPEEGIFEMDLE
jgi:hypothetical protein